MLTVISGPCAGGARAPSTSPGGLPLLSLFHSPFLLISLHSRPFHAANKHGTAFCAYAMVYYASPWFVNRFTGPIMQS